MYLHLYINVYINNYVNVLKCIYVIIANEYKYYWLQGGTK